MKHRNPLAIVGLSIITLGIYDLYWLADTRTELNAKTKQRVPSIWLLIAPAIVLIVGYILLIADSSIKSSSGSNNLGVAVGAFALIAIGWLVTILISIIWFYKYSKAVNEYTSGKMTTAVSFLVLWLIHLIGVALVQDAFNDIAETASPVGSATYPVQPSPMAVNPSISINTPPASPPAPGPIQTPPVNPTSTSPQPPVSPSSPPQIVVSGDNGPTNPNQPNTTPPPTS